ncbi:MAG: 5-(carboxyamino)imidazole ribonucleotide synthase [Propionicimonas sp.]
MRIPAQSIGVIGGGQLARMLHAASIGLGLRFKLLAEGPAVSAAQVVHEVTVGEYTDPATVAAFAGDCEVITFDHEHVPTQILHDLETAGVAVRPGPAALVHAQDKAVMRARLAGLGVPCPVNAVVADPSALIAFAERHGWPVIAKTSRGGYDGKGVWKVSGPEDAATPFERLRSDAVVIAEEFIDFARELSALVVRRPGGQAVAYAVSESVQTDGICTATITPAPGLRPDQVRDCQAMALRIAEELDVVGVLAVELMQARDGSVVVNELAMRPHNTGHWSIDGALTSQFENHLRAVADLPLGSTALVAPVAVMVNVLGGSRSDLLGGLSRVMAADPGIKVQLYGKDVVPGRKVGHVTAVGDDVDQTTARAWRAARILMGEDDE